MECPKCSNKLELLETDSRQEWSEETYYCEKCEKYFLRRTDFQTQSKLVASDTLKEIEE